MTALELDWQLGLAPEVRLALYGYQSNYGCLPATVWRVPGTVTLLARGPLRLTVAVPWGAIAAAGPGPEEGLAELVRMERPGVRERMPAPPGPAGHPGARLIVRSELPDGSGAGTRTAIETALRLCLEVPPAGDPATADPDAAHVPGCAVLGPRRVSCDLDAAGVRLMLVDTRVRRGDRPAPAEDSQVEQAAGAVTAGEFAALGALLTAAHRRHPGDDEQQAVVSAALRAGALGGRAVADGPGRPALLLVAASRTAQVRAAIGAEFERAGTRPPRCLTFTPGAGPDQPAPL